MLVVSIEIFLSHFAAFCTVEYIKTYLSFLCMTSKLVKKVPMEMEGYISLRDFIFVNVCVRYKGTKCKIQKVFVSA